MIYISSVLLENFKSFGPPTRISLKPFSVFIGPNASGKSNLIDAFRFLQECARNGVGLATKKRGGWNHLQHYNAQSKKISIGIEWKSAGRDVLLHWERVFAITDIRYSLVIDEKSEVVFESGAVCGNLADDSHPQEISSFRRDKERLEAWDVLQKKKLLLGIGKNNLGELFVRNHFQISLAAFLIGNIIRNWRFHKTVPDAARQCAENLSSTVSESGDNLVAVLHRFDTKTGNTTRKHLLDIIQILFPQIEDWRTEQKTGGYITLEIQEKESGFSVPSVAISDGFVRALAMSASMLDAQRSNSAVFMEEPDQGMYHLVVERMIRLMRDFSKEVQIIVTTHNLGFINHCLPEEICLVSKVDGYTEIRTADTTERIAEFLRHHTMDEL